VRRKSSSPADKDVEKEAGSGVGGGRNQPVKFQIAADDDDDDKPAEAAHLLGKPQPPPYIMIESPSTVKIGGDAGTSPTSV